ncbi:MAG TPA: hypothetical protein VFK11_01425 [Candidatus Saccharimonadales bacterium]|nr:hypothetical protein [Candidatus Saccharimonadales bacterium]
MRVSRAEAERAPRQTRGEGIGIKGMAAILLVGAAGIAGLYRAEKISEVKDRIDYAAGRAKEERQVALGLKELKCQDTAGANHPSFSISEAEMIRKGINKKNWGPVYRAGTSYSIRTGHAENWSHAVQVGRPFSMSSRLDISYQNALVDTAEKTRQLDLDSNRRDSEGRLPIERFRQAYASNAQEELADAIRRQNHLSYDQLDTIYDMGAGFTAIPGVDLALSGGELPGIGQLSDETAKAAGVDTAAYDKYDEVIGVAFSPVSPACR